MSKAKQKRDKESVSLKLKWRRAVETSVEEAEEGSDADKCEPASPADLKAIPTAAAGSTSEPPDAAKA